MSMAERRTGPQILATADPSVPGVWQQVALKLRLLRSGRDHEDDVQEALLRLFRQFGPEPSPQDALKLGGLVMFALRVDRSRRPPQRLLGDADAQVYAEVSDHKERKRRDLWHLDTSLAAELGRKGVELLDELLDGATSNKQLARRLRTSPAAVRLRRGRIMRILGQWLGEGRESLGG